MLSCVCVVSVLVWAPCGLKMKQFYTFWCHYVFSEGFASDGRKASRGSRNQVLAGQGAQGVKGPSPELAWSPQVRSDCVYKWERTVMGISVHTAETEMATTPYYDANTAATTHECQVSHTNNKG